MKSKRITDRWRLVGMLSIAFVINYVDRQYLFAIFPRLAKDFALSKIELGMVGSLFTWAYAGCMPFSGWLADRKSRPTLVVVSVALWNLCCLGTALSTRSWELYLSRIAMGMTESLYVPAAIRIIAEYHSGETRSRALSIHGFAQFAGITFGGIYGGWSADHIGWRKGYVAITIMGLAYAAFLRRGMPAIWNHSDSGQLDTSPFKPFLYSPLFYVLSLAFMVFCGMLWILYAWTATFVHEYYALPLTASGFASTFYLQIGAAVGVLVGGWVGDGVGMRFKGGRLPVLAVGLLLCAPSAVTMFAVHALTMMAGASLLFGLFSGLFVANVFASLYDVVDRRGYSLAVGVVNMVGGLGAGAAILMAGVMKDRDSFVTLMLWFASIAVGLAVWVLLSSYRASLRESGPFLKPSG